MRPWPLALFLLSFPGVFVAADDALPFDPGRIHRSSLDELPRSLSIRQGDAFWLGYDLERGTPFHVWVAKPGKPGLIVNGFTTRSDGESLFRDDSGGTWRLRRRGEEIAVSLRYLACSDRGEAIELRWKLRHGDGAVTLRERIPFRPEGGKPDRVVRIVEVSGLVPGEELRPPAAVEAEWILLDGDGAKQAVITGDGTYRLLLP